MVGTPAEKQRRPIRDMQQQTTEQQRLSTQQRRTKAGQQFAAEDEARKKAEELSALGSLSTRVQGLVTKRLQLGEEAEGLVNQAEMENIPVEHQDKANSYLQDYLKDPTNMELLAEINNFWKDSGMGEFDPNRYTTTDVAALSEAAQQQIEDNTFLQDLELSDEEVASLEMQFGENGWQNFTVPEMQQQIRDLEQAEFDRVRGLHAQLATARGAQRESILQELKQLSQTGVTGTEQNFDTFVDQINNADVVEFGGQEFRIDELLSDKEVNNQIYRWFAEDEDSDFRKAVKENNPKFAEWVEENSDSLEDLSNEMGKKQTRLLDIQDEKKALAMIDEEAGLMLNDKAMMAMLGDDWTDFVAEVPDISDEGFIQYANSGIGDDQKAAFVTALNGAKKKELNEIVDMNGTEVGKAFTTGQAMEEHADVYKDLMDYDKLPKFVTDTDEQKEFDGYKKVIDAIDDTDSGSMWMANKDFIKYMKNGQIDSDSVQDLIANPEKFEEHLDYNKFVEQVNELGSMSGTDFNEGVLEFLFGTSDVDLATLEKEYGEAKDMAAYAPWSEAGKRYEDLKKIIGDDGKFDETDAKSIYEQIKGDLNVGKDGTGASLKDMLADDTIGDFDMRGEFEGKGLDKPFDDSPAEKDLLDYMKTDPAPYSKKSIQGLLDSGNTGVLETLLKHAGNGYDIPSQYKGDAGMEQLKTDVVKSYGTKAKGEVWGDNFTDMAVDSGFKESGFENLYAEYRGDGSYTPSGKDRDRLATLNKSVGPMYDTAKADYDALVASSQGLSGDAKFEMDKKLAYAKSKMDNYNQMRHTTYRMWKKADDYLSG
jgi:hypothetical protein